jgi:putative spermidine/putrescine transport system permease protein
MDLTAASNKTVQGTTQERKRVWGSAGHWVVVVAIVVAVIAPLLPLAIWSFSFRWYFPDLLPSELSMRAWKYVFSDASGVPRAMVNSILVAITVTLISIAIGIPAGRALGMHHFRGKRLVEFSILAPPIVPGLAVVMGIHVAFIKFGLADTMPGVILVHLIPTTPYMVMVMAGVFANYNPEFEEQARVLGAGPAATFRHVTLPAILPGVVVGGLFAFIISWSQYVLTLLIGGGNVLTLPVLLFSFAGSGDNAITAALSVTFIAPAILFLILTSRFLTGESAAVGGFGGGV